MSTTVSSHATTTEITEGPRARRRSLPSPRPAPVAAHLLLRLGLWPSRGRIPRDPPNLAAPARRATETRSRRAAHPRSLLLLRSLPPGSAPHAVPRVPGLGHLGGFWFGATVGTAAVDVRVPAFAWVPVVIFRGSIFKSGLRFARSTVRLGSRDGDQGRVAVRWAGLVMSSK